MTKARVKYVDLAAQNQGLLTELLGAAESVLSTGDFIMGSRVETFEKRFADLCGTRHALAVANGTDAIVLAFKALDIGPGDEVITVANSFIATAGAIVQAGATPVFVDVREDLNIDPDKIEAAITPRTRAILPVHLTGKAADLAPIQEIALRHSLHIVEDAAQAVGAEYRGKRAGNLGVIGCFSLHPLKNLSACGDAGIITTNDDALHRRMSLLRNHGLRNRDESEIWGVNSRLDTLQAAFLTAKLDHLEGWTAQRRDAAAFYSARLEGVVGCPSDNEDTRSVYHTYVIRCDRRDELQSYLAEAGIETKVHYPIPIHFQPAARDLGYREGDLPVTEKLAKRILSLPIHPDLTLDQKQTVVEAVQDFYRKG